MRIISGIYGGRRISPPKTLPVRPTTDIAREALFNILQNRVDFENIRVLDLFSGTGSVSYEFASRGVEDQVAIELNHRCESYIRETAKEFGIEGLKIYRADVFKIKKERIGTFDLIFADPPYDLKRLADLPDVIFEKELLNDEGILILEHPGEYSFSKDERFVELRNYGKVNFSFFQKK